MMQYSDKGFWAGFSHTNTMVQICLLIGMCLFVMNTGLAQSQEPGSSAAPNQQEPASENAGPKAFSATAIADQAISSTALRRNAEAQMADDDNFQYIKTEYTQYLKNFNDLQKETRRKLKSGGSATILEETKRKWEHIEVRIDGWLQSLTNSADSIESNLERVKVAKKQWELTADSKTEDLPAELRKTVTDTIESMARVEKELRKARDDVLTLQGKVGELKANTVDILEEQKRNIAKRRSSVFSLDSAPLWRIFNQPSENDTSQNSLVSHIRETFDTLVNYLDLVRSRLATEAVIFVLLLGTILAMRRIGRKLPDSEQSLQSPLKILGRPFAAATSIFLPMIIIFHPGAPPAWISLLGLVLIFALLRLTPRLFHPSKQAWAHMFSGVIFVWACLQVLSAEMPLYRLMLLLLSAMGLGLCQMILMGSRQNSEKDDSWALYLRFLGRVGAGLFILTLIANVLGSVSLAEIVTDGTFFAIFSAFLLVINVLVVEGIVSIVLSTRVGHWFGFVRGNPEVVNRTISRLLRFLAFVTWLYIVLSSYLVIDPAVSFIKDILGFEISAGNLAVSLADILIFMLVTWLSFKLSSFIQFILSNDVYPHMQLPRGAPDAINSLTHYAVIVLGVILALAAAGFDLSHITIIFGALGVGVGFGLQNVVNNFVSGLILLFERPIKLRDVVEIDGELAIVKKIAMRASVVRDYNGANIIVPNSDLISAKVINWTYRSEIRRCELNIGVAYGSDPQHVIDLLTNVAKDNSRVATKPAPEVLFLDFGDSSLDFVLRIWTSVDIYMQVSSELRVGISQTLAAAGIEIPFPQRDLHLRNSDVIEDVIKGRRATADDEPDKTPDLT